MSGTPNSGIGASELVVTPEGHIYHLDLSPEQVAPTVITVGDPGRVSEVSRHFDRIEHKAGHREFITHTGYVGRKRISVISTGIGPDNIDIVLNELDALVNIDFETRLLKPKQTSLRIIRLGTAGALQKDIPLDATVVSSFGVGLDNLLHFYEPRYNAEEKSILDAFKDHLALKGIALEPYVAQASSNLRNRFTEGFIHGITVTCPGFYGPQGRRLRGSLAFPDLIGSLADFESRGQRITNFEMETAALYGLGKLLGHSTLSISAILANRIDNTFSPSPKAAVQNMIERCMPIIEAL